MHPTGTPRHLYVHVPFCVRACDYCAFYKEAGAPPELRAAWLDGLEREAALRLPGAEALHSVYIGGGTPSYLDVAEWQRLLAILGRHAILAPGAEFSVEANPVSLTPDKLSLWRDHGVNRVTLGLQTFSPELRTTIGRAGTADRVPTCFAALRDAGFDNLGADLIYAIPGQTLAMLDDDLARLAALRPAHVSTYSLMLEPGTPLAERLDETVDDDLSAAMWERAGETLAATGLVRYEVSNLALPGRECRHNVAVWYGEPFLGLGPSASWYSHGVRYTNPPDLRRWLAGEPPEPDPLPPDQRAVEILASGLRVVDGWTPERFAANTGFDYLDLRREALRRLAGLGLVELGADTLRLTSRGLLFADYVARELY